MEKFEKYTKHTIKLQGIQTLRLPTKNHYLVCVGGGGQ